MFCYLPMNRNTHQLKISVGSLYFNTLNFNLDALPKFIKIENKGVYQRTGRYSITVVKPNFNSMYLYYDSIEHININRIIYNEGAYSLFYKNEYMENKVDEFIKTVLNNLLQFGKYRVIINGLVFYSDMYYFFFNEEILTVVDKEDLLNCYEIKYRNINDIEICKIISGE